MELQPKLLAAADMCEAGEDVNLDELAFLLRYASDELAARPEAVVERNRLIDRLRRRLTARCDLLDRPASDRETAEKGGLDALEVLDETLDTELRTRFVTPAASVALSDTDTPAPETPFPAEHFTSGR